jgi:hypothetical protein
LKVVSITGDTAQIEYSHNGHKEVGTANVDRNTITYGNVTIATRDGQQGALEFSFGIVRQAAVINKVTAPVDQNKLVGSWVGSSDTQTHVSRSSPSRVGMRRSDITSMGRAGRVSATSSTIPCFWQNIVLIRRWIEREVDIFRTLDRHCRRSM